MHPLLELMAAHRSVRSFLPEPVPEEQLRDAITAARQAATSSWIHAYSLIQISEPAVRSRLAHLCADQTQVETAGAFFVVCGDTRRHRLLAERAGASYVSNFETFLLAVVDACLFAQNLTLALEALGYGTCYIGALRNRLPEVDALLELPAGVWPLFGLCAGVPDPAIPTAPRPRLPLAALWMRERYLDDDALLAEIDAFDRVAAQHYDERGLAGRDWSGGVWRKFTRAAREDLLAFYTAKGARLE